MHSTKNKTKQNKKKIERDRRRRSLLFLCAEYIVTDMVYLHMLDKFLASVEEGPNNVVVHQDGNSPCFHIAVWVALYWIKI